MSGHVANVGDVELNPASHGVRFASSRAPLGKRIGLRPLGCTLTVVPPGKRAYPFHSHGES